VNAVMLDDIAHGNDEKSQGRKLRAELGEDAAEFGDEKLHEERDDADGQAGQDDGIDHGGFDFALEFLLASAEVGDLAKDDVEEAAGFAGSNHGDIDGGEI